MAKSKQEQSKIVAWATDKAIPLRDRVSQMMKLVPIEYGSLGDRKILACKLLPDWMDYTVTDLCDAAGVSRKAWYRAHAKPEFGKHCVELAKQLKGPAATGVMLSFIEAALNGDVKAQIALLQDVEALSRPEAGKSGDINVNVTIGELEQKRKENWRRGLDMFGFKVDEKLHTDS